MNNFDFEKAQKYELDWQIDYNVNNFEKQYADLIEFKKTAKTGLNSAHFFNNDADEFNKYLLHIENKNLLEVGCGSFPMARYAWNIQDKTVIDPIADEYYNFQMNTFGKTNFENIKIYSKPAEVLIPELVDNIIGVIIFRNALDHSNDPIAVLETVSRYAAKGCYLCFWSDIWHKKGEPEGHRNITYSKNAMDKIFIGLGFDKIISSNLIRDPEVFVEYGGVFIKK